MSRVVTMALAICLAALAAMGPPARGQGKLVVHGEGRDLGPTPVTVAVKGSLTLGPLTAQDDSGKAFPVLGYEFDGRSYLATVLPSVRGQGTRTYELSRSGSKPGGAAVSKPKDSPNLTITLDGKPFTTLDLGTGPKPYLFPVIGPTGQPFTRAFPMKDVEGEDRDHPHQRSFWFTHGKVNGVDFWSEGQGHGRIVPRLVRSVGQESGSAAVVVKSNDAWLDNKGEEICEDERTLTFYGLDSPRVIDFDITLKATNGPVTLGDTKEGMFGLRVASSMDVQHKAGGKITNAAGITDGDAWGKASPWVDYTGPVAGKTVGVAILNHPDSFRYPTTWHVRDYGLFAANPFGYHDFGQAESGDHTIPAGGKITFRYRVVLHEGDTKSADVASAFASYASPPRLEVVGQD